MEKEEVLNKASKKKCVVGEMEQQKIIKGNWIALIVTAVVLIIFIVVEGILRHHEAQFALGAVCFLWASIFYFCQYFLAKRPWQVLIGAVLEGAAAIAMIVLFILTVTGVIL